MSQIQRNLLRMVGLRLSSELKAQAVDLGRSLITRDTALERSTLALVAGHANAAYAGRALAGSREPLGALDQVVGRMAAEDQAQYFEKFLSDIKSGRYTDPDSGELREAQIETRASSYTERLRGTANESWVNTLGVDTLIFWRLGGDEGGSCSICPDLAQQGPYKASELPTIPGNNETPCLFNCRCYLEAESGEGFKCWIPSSTFGPSFGLHSALCAHHHNA